MDKKEKKGPGGHSTKAKDPKLDKRKQNRRDKEGKYLKKFRPEYCEMLVSHMSEGRSFETFGAKINVSAGTLYLWTKNEPLFAEAKKIGELCSKDAMETKLLDGLNSKFFNAHVAGLILNMRRNVYERISMEAEYGTDKVFEQKTITINLSGASLDDI